MAPALAALLPFVDTIIDKFVEDPDQKLKAKQSARTADLTELQTAMQPALAEAQSDDPWTSRARPSFLYIMYIYMLLAPLFGLGFWIDPVAATAVIDGMDMFLTAIPGEMWTLFGVGFLGYGAYRTKEKLELTRNPLTKLFSKK